MAAHQDPVRGRFIHQVGEFGAGLGLSRSVGQLYALLYMSAEPMCLDEMAEACRMSKASASVNVRELERWGAVRFQTESGAYLELTGGTRIWGPWLGRQVWEVSQVPPRGKQEVRFLAGRGEPPSATTRASN